MVSAHPMSVLLSGLGPHLNVSQAEAKGRAQPHKVSLHPRQGGHLGPDTLCPPNSQFTLSPPHSPALTVLHVS